MACSGIEKIRLARLISCLPAAWARENPEERRKTRQGQRPGTGKGALMHWRDRIILAFCRVEPAGLSPVMPGTCGSLAGMLLAPFLFLPLSLGGLVCVLGLLFAAGGIASTRAELLLGRSDPGEVVIDEVLGQWLTYLPFGLAAGSLGWRELLLGLVLFRVFDIVKPWPVNAAETLLPGGYGVMLDDVAAGLYAAPCLALLRLWM
jgi:phosphatidylglycerophosphatase A